MNTYRTSRPSCNSAEPTPPAAPWISTLARSDLSGTMQHLVRRDVVQDEADSLGGVQPRWHRNQFTLRQADELRVRTADRQRGNYLAWFDSGDTGRRADPPRQSDPTLA